MQILMLTQVYPKDPAAVGQYFEDAAISLAEQGHRVTVLTADRDYDDPLIRYDNSSRHSGIRVVRLPFTSFGKRSILHRLLGQASYLGQCFLRLLFARQIGVVVFTTIPATTGVMYLFLRLFRRFQTVYWVMDINPDQAVALGAFRAGSLPEKLLGIANRRLVQRADAVVTLDEFMAKRLQNKLKASEDPRELIANIRVIPLWPLKAHQMNKNVEACGTGFREKMGWVDRQVVMYSGNHSLVHPLDDLLLGIQEEAEWRGVVFAFVGGGRGKLAAERLQAARDARDVVCLPYQPLETLSESLASADFHIVVMGPKMVGIVHPCKIYGALAIGRPILFFGPRDSAAGQLVARHQLGWIFEPGAAPSEVAAHLKEALASDASVREKMAARGRALMRSQFSPEELSRKFCDLIEDIAIKSS